MSPPDPIAAAVKLFPPPPVISVMMPPEALKAWSFVPALTLLNTTVENTGRMDEMPSTIHSAVAPIEVVLGGLVMPILVAWLVGFVQHGTKAMVRLRRTNQHRKVIPGFDREIGNLNRSDWVPFRPHPVVHVIPRNCGCAARLQYLSVRIAIDTHPKTNSLSSRR
jgi:hypothetical protein